MPSASPPPPLLQVDDLNVSFPDRRRSDSDPQQGLLRVSFEVPEASSVAVVGESGSGKSLAALAILGLLPSAPSCNISGRILFRGRDLLQLSEPALNQIRGAQLAMSFQEPESALDPSATIGRLLIEPIRSHLSLSRTAARQKAEQVLAMVGVPNPRQTFASFPHELSGGTRQRVMLALALSCNPKLLIADQPTSGIDPTTRAQLLDVLQRVQEEHGTSLLLITHDLGMVAENASQVVVMYAGEVIEAGKTTDVLLQPAHPYTRALLDSVPPADPVGPPESRRLPVIALGSGVVDPQPGCRFRTRCELRQRLEQSGQEVERCEQQSPSLRQSEQVHVRCHFAELLYGA